MTKRILFHSFTFPVFAFFFSHYVSICYATDLNNVPIKSAQQGTYILKVKFPPKIKIPIVSGYYKGYNLEFDKDICIFQEGQTCDKFILAITEKIKRSCDNSSLQYLERIPDKKTRLFYLSRTSNKNKPWIIEEEKPKNIPLKLPRNTLVLFLNPDHVDGIDANKNTKTLSVIKDQIITLPFVVIRPNISEKELKSTSDEILLASIDCRNIHPNAPKEVKVAQSSVTSIRTFDR